MATDYDEYLRTPEMMKQVLQEHGFRPPFQSKTVGIAWEIRFKGGRNPVEHEQVLQRIAEEVIPAVDKHESLVWIKSFEEVSRGGQQTITAVFRCVGRSNPAVHFIQRELDARAAIQDRMVKCVARGCSEMLKPSETVCPLCKTEQVHRVPVDLNTGLEVKERAAAKPRPVTHMRALEIPPGGEIPILLEELKKAKAANDAVGAKRIRVRLRKLGYFLSGKK